MRRLTCNNLIAYLENWTDNFFQIFFMGTSWVAVSINNIKTRASREMTSRKKISTFSILMGWTLPSTGMWRARYLPSLIALLWLFYIDDHEQWWPLLSAFQWSSYTFTVTRCSFDLSLAHTLRHVRAYTQACTFIFTYTCWHTIMYIYIIYITTFLWRPGHIIIKCFL